MVVKYKRNQKKLTPFKVVCIYLIAFILVSVHEIDRIVPWIERISLDWKSYPTIEKNCGVIRAFSQKIGIPEVVAAENSLLAWASELPQVGGSTETVVANNIQAAITVPEKTEKTEAMETSLSENALKEEHEAPVGPEVVKTEDESNTVPQVEEQTPETSIIIADDAAAPELQPEVKVAEEGTAPEKDDLAKSQTDEAPVIEKSRDITESSQGKNIGNKQAKLRPKKILLAGDSMMLEGLGPVLQRKLMKYPGLKVVREGKYSSGLSRPDFFDWMANLETILDKHKPDLLVVCLGANDTQDILDGNRKRHIVKTESWNKIYEQRAEQFLGIAEKKGVRTFWIGLPIMGKKTYNSRVENLNGLQKKACEAKANCDYIDTWLVLADSKNQYTTFIKDSKGRHIRIRSKDLIHLTESGGDVISDYFIEKTKKYIELPLDDGTYASDKKNSLEKPEIIKNPPARDLSTNISLNTLYSEARGKETKYYAFVPEAQDENKDGKMPVLYLLHGALDGYDAWKTNAGDQVAMLAQRHGIVVITPDGDPFGWYADSPFDQQNRIETFFIEELIPDVENRFPVDPKKRGVAGLSMGGHGAFALSLRNPGLFNSISSMSGVLDITRHSEEWELERVFGVKNDINTVVWNSYSALVLAEQRKDLLSDTPVLITVSTGDSFVLEDNRLFHKRLSELGVKHQYKESPGNHDWKYWVLQLPEHMAFHAQALTTGGQEQ